ncbi:DUF4268 domain-containing protein [Bradymonadaceae bacterium TMQ3]|nr:DUF4268 domain-containing protein [Bradymonadaceae bacterium TMQ3]TXC74699.1 DUF4268 domain-containing protein [Bradymonadales bacterium TMQ1]
MTKRIEGRARTVRELLDGARYTIDFYQREYAWQERQVRELIDDLSGKFLDFYQPEHARRAVADYGHYFLGSIVISHKRGQRFIVDGQQRLTTLSLLLIFLNHQQRGIEGAVDVTKLIYSERFGTKDFNLEVPEREGVMQTLLEGGSPNLHDASESVVTIARRYENIGDHFPEEISGEVLPYFVDWLLENVHLVEIEAYKDEDAYTIFETMNDRGLSLSLAEMLKGYVLANITDEEDQRAVNTTWKAHMQAFKEFGDDEDIDFFKNWLRARYAETIRPGKKGAENKDYERIGSEFHRWVRDQRERMGLKGSDSFVRFVQRDLNFYGKYALAIRKASTTVTEGWESIYFNEDRGFTLQHQALLAALHPGDSDQVVRQKVRLVADFLDIWLARRVWNFRTIAYSSVKYTLFMLTRELRHRNVQELSAFLREQLDAQPETFVTQPRLRLHNQNYRQIRHILARLTHWVDAQCGLTSHFEDLVSQGRARPFEIEHIWADDYDRFADDFAHPSEFEVERNRLGGLLLLQRGLNQSLGDATFEAKRDAYVTQGESMLARSLHPAAYAKSPGFRALRERTGLAFKAYESFGPEAQAERQELYIRIAEWVWNPSRLEVDGGGERAPVHGEIVYAESRGQESEPSRVESAGDARRFEARYGFWKVLLAESHARSELHTNISPGRASYVGARRHGQEWNYVVLMEETRVELYINCSNPADNKPLFDALHAEREAIEAAFGDNLDWQRLDDKKVSRISYTVSGGWADEARWGEVAGRAVGAMERLYGVLGERVGELEGV